MTNKQHNKFGMYRAVLALLESSPAVVAEIKALADAKASLATEIDVIGALAQQQSQPLAAARAGKDEAMADLARATIEVSGALTAYASEKGLPDLREQVKLKRSELLALRDAAQVTRAQQIHAAALPLVANLADFDVTAASLTALQAKIDVAAASLSAPRSAIGARRTATVGLNGAFARADEVLELRIDRLVEKLQARQPAFYAHYRSARVIVDVGGGHATAKGTTTLTAKPAAGAPAASTGAAAPSVAAGTPTAAS